LSARVGGGLSHLPLRIQMRAIGGKPDSAKQKDTQGYQDEDDGLSRFPLSMHDRASQNVITP
jgi:hypothetical protein